MNKLASDSPIGTSEPKTTAPEDTHGRLRRTIEHLASFERGPASDGERRGADWIRGELEQLGVKARIELEPAVGNYWLPLSLLSAGGALAGLLALTGHRRSGFALGAIAAAAVADDVGHARRWFRRAALPKRPTFNVIGELGAAEATRTVVINSHHDAAPSGLLFHPAVAPALHRIFPAAMDRSNTSPPVMLPVFLAPVLSAAGALTGRRGLALAGLILSLGSELVFADIARSKIVPGANDNLSAVAASIELAQRFAEQPPPDLRIIFLSTGSEESNSEGMHGWARRHLGGLSRERTLFVILETIGSPRLFVMEGEGMLRMREYPKDVIAHFRRAADGLSQPLVDDLRLRNATDGIIALRAGYSTALVASCDEFKFPSNYHWPSDTPENIDWSTVEAAIELTEAAIRDLAAQEQWPFSPPAAAREWR